MLKRAALSLALTWIASTSTCAAATSADFVVGSVRDEDGVPIVRADVRLLGAEGAVAGSGRTDGLGTFAIVPSATAVSALIRCPHCRTTSLPLGENTNLAIVVTRYRALESDIPDARDLAALPYGRPADIFALVPFVLGGENGRPFVSDRGLGGARGLASDDGAPLIDLATGTSALTNVPERLANDFGLARADRAYRYGASAGGGLFTIDTLGSQSRANTEIAAASSLALAPVFGDVHPVFGVSSDDGTLARRADIDSVSIFSGGTLRAGITTASEHVGNGTLEVLRAVSGARIAYATASRNYRTFTDASANDVAVSGNDDYRSSYLTADFRLERPGAVELATGFRATRETASYVSKNVPSYTLTGYSDVGTLYAEATSTIGQGSLHGALAVDDVATAETLTAHDRQDARALVLPEFDARIDLAGGAYARAGYSRSIRLPTLIENDAVSARLSTTTFERADLIESALGIDTGKRVRAEAIAYREETSGFSSRGLTGIGASIAWQIAPRLSLRAWSLRANVTAPSTLLLDLADTTRGVLWATYSNGEALRFDAIVHRDLRGARRAIVALDGDVYVPVDAHIALDLGTSRRDDIRRYSLGIRVH